ncbi:MAG TPA: hypothetical protein VHF69_12875, partial [Candidatus Synoicihabitans sp.]|nr:hypothetical protein [Candidatus Synoicihabitans sp.]
VAEASGILHPSGLATIQLAAIEGSSLLNLLTVPLGLAIFAVVWMASHAINVLILLSPWGAVDAALKAARTGVLGLVTLTATLDPYVSVALSLVIIVFAYFIAGWAFRLTTFGSLFCWDFFTGASGRFRVKPTSNPLFSAGKLKGVPPRTYGRLVQRDGGELVFVYRPWLVLPVKEVSLPSAHTIAVGRGFFFSLLEVDGGGLALLLPRYRGHEDELVAAAGFSGVRDAGLRKAWSWIRETLGFGPKVTAGAV